VLLLNSIAVDIETYSEYFGKKMGKFAAIEPRIMKGGEG
jgi:hypothetical protein|tara:strand:+ start:2341 stop:2457 length:117 start_codon:yes stop_codon:yes gene_type:complete